MALTPLTPVTDYQSMLNRIFWFTSAAALVAVSLLREKLPALDLLLAEIDFNLQFGGNKILPIPASYLLPAVGVGLLSRVFRIHGKLASWLGIRERFDIDVIIHELAVRSGVNLDDVSDNQLVAHRHEIMRHAFYQFVSGTQPAIDKQLIDQALDVWSWFWIGLESSFVFVVTGLVLIALGAQEPGYITLLATLLIAAAGLPAIRTECKRYGIAQVRAIVSDSARVEAVRQAFCCLSSGISHDQRAA